MHKFQIFTLFVVTSIVRPLILTTNSGSGEMEEILEATPSNQHAQMDQETTKEVELVVTSDAETTPSDAETTPSIAVETGATTVTWSLPYAPYNCSVTSRSQKAWTIASFLKGWSLIVDELNTRVLRNLVQVPTSCPPTILSMLNVAGHPTINLVQGLQGVANSISKMDAYLRLIQLSQRENYSEDMQALHDILSGTILDLYKVLSPTYCNCTIPAAEETNSSDCFTIPQLSIRYFTENCNLISYISATIFYELQFLHSLSLSWLESQDVGPLPEITNLDWLFSHVNKLSPAITKLA